MHERLLESPVGTLMEHRLGVIRLILTPIVFLRVLQERGWEGWPSGLMLVLLSSYLVVSHLGARAHLRDERRMVLLLGVLEAVLVAGAYTYDANFNLLLFFLAATLGARFPLPTQLAILTFAWSLGATHDLIREGWTAAACLDVGMEWVFYFITAFVIHSLVREEQAHCRHAVRATVLHQIGQATGMLLDVEVILANLCTHTDQLYGQGSCHVYLCTEDRLAAHSTATAVPELPISTPGAVGRAFRDATSVLLPDAHGDPDLAALCRGKGVCPAAAVPLLGKTGALGVIAVVCQTQSLDMQDVQLLETIASQAAAAIDHAALYRETVERTQMLEQLYELSKELDQVHSVKGVVVTSSGYALRLVEAEVCVGLLPDLDGDHFYCAGGEGEKFAGFSGLVLRSDHPALSRALSAGQPVEGDSEELGLELGERYRCCLLPLVNEHLPVGALLLLRSPAAPFSEREVHPLFTLARQAAVSVHSAQLFEEARARAISDGLTGLYNHRHFQERLREEIARASRYRLNLALMMLDVDDFKRLNDAEGHPRGDVVLQAVARVLRSFARSTDVVARYGGEEFAIIVLEAGTEQAVGLGERIRNAVKRMSVVAEEPLRERLTISIGVAAYPENGVTAPELIAAADRALGQAKRLGKDSVVAASPMDATQA